jgi:hypothetical protein
MLLLPLPLPPHVPCPFLRVNSRKLIVGGTGSFFKGFAAAASNTRNDSAARIHAVVKELVQLPDDTLVYPEHKYGDHT